MDNVLKTQEEIVWAIMDQNELIEKMLSDGTPKNTLQQEQKKLKQMQKQKKKNEDLLWKHLCTTQK